MPQLPDITRPMMIFHHTDRCRCQRRNAVAGTTGELDEVVLGNWNDVLPAGTQWGDVQFDSIQPIV